MAIIIEIRFAHPDGALADTLDSLPDLDVTVVREASTDPGQSVYLLRLDEEDTEEIRAMLEADHTVREVRPMPGFEDQQLWRVSFTPETKLLAPRVTSEGGLVLEARSTSARHTPRGWHERWLLPDHEAIHEVWKHARSEGFEFEVLDLRQQGHADPDHPSPDALTEEQREALVAAYERGYFAEPRETSLEELAGALGISATAVSGRLKRGMKSLIGMMLVADEYDESEE